MNHLLGIALIAYLTGAVIEGIYAASHLSHSRQELDKVSKEASSDSADPPQVSWQVVAVIASVSICGGFVWPCRLIHRSLKREQAT